MIKNLLIQAFEKAKKETKNNTPNGQAKHIAKLMSESYNSPITQKSMMRYYDGESTPKSDLRNALSQYLGYTNYEDFVRGNKKTKFPNKKLIGSILIVISVFAYFGINWQQGKCMIWIEDHYEPIACSQTDGLDISLNEDVMQKFKKVNPDTIGAFFENGKALYWYSKYNGQIELFTQGGKHPERGNILRPVTEQIVRTHFLKDE